MPHFAGDDGTNINQTSQQTPIAIIGLSCRLPGDASTPQNFWDFLLKGRSAYSKIPPERWNVDSFHDPLKKRLNTSVTEGGHFLKQNIAAFDANFFNISQNEAQAIDPQQRMMLEVAYEALENSGIALDKIAGTQTGCFVGQFTSDYREALFRDVDSAPRYAGTGAGPELLSNRLSWFYDLKGPSLTTNTACSSGLVALHLACQSIRTGESKMAVVGGSNLLLDPAMFLMLSNQQFLSPDGLCQSFDSRANGYSRGEGFATVILKPIDDAIRDGDPIRAVIRGTGINQDGKTKGITLPSAEAQAELIRSTYASAGIGFENTNYFEAHGTGTKAGDPLELEAISKTLGTARPSNQKLVVGSVKSNIGHLESVAGLAGLLKGIFILEKGIIPPSIHYKNGNPSILFDDWKISVPVKPTLWPTKGLRRLSVNSFGYGGTNAHAVLDDAYSYLLERGAHGLHYTIAHPTLSESGGVVAQYDANGNGNTNGHVNGLSSADTKLYILAASDQDGLKRQREAIAKYLRERLAHDLKKDEEEAFLQNLAFTLGDKRSSLPWKTYVTASSAQSLADVLEDQDITNIASRSTNQPRLGFVFTGQGAQWAKMGIELFRYKVFEDSVLAADKYLTNALQCPWSVVAELERPDIESSINAPEMSQPICTVLQVALVDLLSSWNVSPSAVIGHSSGEIAAAYCLGSLTREDAWKVAYHRGILSSQLKTIAPELEGGMMAVGASESEAWDLIAEVSDGELVVACVNSPSSVTISGDMSGIHQLEAILKKKGIFNRKLKVETAYHSPHMQVISSLYLEAISDVNPMPAYKGRNMFSSVSGDLIDPLELGPANWVRNLVSPVLFSDALHNLLRPTHDGKRSSENAVDVLVELGPHAALQGPSNQVMKKHGITSIEYKSLLSRGRNAIDTVLDCAGSLKVFGSSVNIAETNNVIESSKLRLLVDLPPYAWNHTKTFWGESRIAKQLRLRKNPRTSLLGAPYPALGESESLWRGFIRVGEEPWTRDHKIQSSILYPAAGFLAMAIEAARQRADANRVVKEYKLRDVLIDSAVVLKDDEDVECICQLRPHLVGTRDNSSTWWEFTISTCTPSQDLRKNCSGLLVIQYEVAADSAAGLESRLDDEACRVHYQMTEKLCTNTEEASSFYSHLSSLGLTYGPTFQNVTQITKGVGKSVCSVEIPDTDAVAFPGQNGRPHIIHPATLDAMFHLAFAAVKDQAGQLDEAMVPNSIDEVVVVADMPFAVGTQFKGFSTAAKHGFRELKANIQMLDTAVNKALVKVKGFCCASVSGMGAIMEDSDEIMSKKICGKLVWKPSIDFLSTEEKRMIVHAASTDTIDQAFMERFEKSEFLAMVFIYRDLEHVPYNKVPPGHLQDQWKWMKDQQQLVKDCQHPLQSIFGESFEERVQTVVHSEFLSTGPEDRAVYLAGTTLVQILLGNNDATQLLLQESLLDRYLYNTLGMKQCLSRIEKFIDLSVHTHADSKILELGGACGGAVSALLSSIHGFALDYTYASPNAAVQKLAEEKLDEFKTSLNFKVYDIAKPDASGIKDQSYDIIIAINAFYSTQDVDSALISLKRHLKPGGKLCLVEMTNPGVQASCILGCLPSWWSRKDSEHADATSFWESKLKNQGFNIEFVCQDYDDPQFHQLSLFVAEATEPEASNGTHSKEITLIEPPFATQISGGLAAQICLDLEELGYTPKRIKWSSDVDIHQSKETIVMAELETPLLPILNQQEFTAMQKLILQSTNILWVTAHNEPTGSMASGLARCVRNESANIKFRTLQLRPESLQNPDRVTSHIVKVSTSSTADEEFLDNDGLLQVSRVIEDSALNEELAGSLQEGKVDTIPLSDATAPQKLRIGSPGMLDTLQFETDALAQTELKPGEVEIEVKATGLNFRDVMVAMGQIPDSLLGFEASGVVNRVAADVTRFKPGDRICSLGHGAHRTHFRNKSIFCQAIPDGMTFEEAACFPLVHATAYHAMVNIMRVRPGQSILIHAAAGGVGQAAIQLAQHFNMEIFATVGSIDKKSFIQEHYGISEDHILHSRDTSFAKGIMRLTNMRGVDCVLNSLSGEALRETWHCIAPFGTFVEIGMKDILGNTRLDMRPFMQDATFSFLNLEHVQRVKPELMSEIIEGTFDFLRQKITRPVAPLTIYPVSDMESAFRLMQAGKHRGKIAISFATDDNVVQVLRNPAAELKLKMNATYVLVGGLGGLGQSLAHLLVEHGARCLCFISRSGATSVESKQLVDDLKNKNVVVRVFACDVADEEALSNTIKQGMSDLPPIRGVIQGAMVLRDSLFENMTHSQWTESIRPKVMGSWNLHKQFLEKDSLDFFTLLSSFAGVFGNRGQGNYAAAGAYQDALAHYRNSLGLKAVSVDLGIMRDVGVLATGSAAANRDLQEWFEPFGIRENEFHALMRKTLSSQISADVSSRSSLVTPQVLTGFATGATAAAAKISPPFYFSDPRFTIMSLTGLRSNNAAAVSSSNAASLKEQLAAASNTVEAQIAITDAIVQKVAKSLQTSPSEIDTTRPLHSYGVDSLVAVEIRNWLFREAKAEVSVFDVLAAVPIKVFAGKAVKVSGHVKKEILESDGKE